MISSPDSPHNSWWREVERLQATRITAPAPEPSHSKLCNRRIGNMEECKSQYGFVHIWNPRAVNLQFFSLAQHPLWQQMGKNRSHQKPAPNNTHLSDTDNLRWRLGVALQAPLELLLCSDGPLQWPHPFFSYQQEGIRALLNSRHLLLADEMGLGKTIMCIAALRILLHRQEIERALIVTPASVLDQWQRELAHWAPELRSIIISGTPDDRAWQWRYPAHVTLVSYDTLRSDWDGESSLSWGVVVLDEAQRIKNSDTDNAFVCKNLARSASWALTGTPLENSAEDTHSILEFVTSGKPLDGSLRSALQRYQLRRRKADVLQQLPPKISSDLLLPLSPAQRQAYDVAEREGRIKLSKEREIRIEHVLALIARLKQICNFTVDGASSKMDNLEERLAKITASGEKALIFTQYTNAENGARRIAQRLQKFAPLIYTGDMNAVERSNAIDRFNRDDTRKVLVLSLHAGGQGLNLQRASYVFHFDLWWNPAILQQAEGRTHRLGQNRPVHIYRYLMHDTIETRIADILRDKTDLFDQLVEGISLDPKQLFTRKELLEMVGL